MGLVARAFAVLVALAFAVLGRFRLFLLIAITLGLRGVLALVFVVLVGLALVFGPRVASGLGRGQLRLSQFSRRQVLPDGRLHNCVAHAAQAEPGQLGTHALERAPQNDGNRRAQDDQRAQPSSTRRLSSGIRLGRHWSSHRGIVDSGSFRRGKHCRQHDSEVGPASESVKSNDQIWVALSPAIV